jgi:hypothetical protein
MTVSEFPEQFYPDTLPNPSDRITQQKQQQTALFKHPPRRLR